MHPHKWTFPIETKILRRYCRWIYECLNSCNGEWDGGGCLSFEAVILMFICKKGGRFGCRKCDRLLD
jgi:hypothetical protein